MWEKSGPLGSNPAEVAAGNNAKMFPFVDALIFANLDMDVELDKVLVMVLFPLAFFSVTRRSTRCSFCCCWQNKVEAGKDVQLEEVDSGGICPLGQVVSDTSITEPVGLFGSCNAPTICFGDIGTTSDCCVGLDWKGCVFSRQVCNIRGVLMVK